MSNEAAVVSKETEVREAVARANKFFVRYEDMGRRLDSFMGEFKQLRHDVIQLLNDKASIDAAVKGAELKVAQAEKEAAKRLDGIEMGHRSLVDRLTKQDLAMQAKMAEMEKRELILNQKNYDLEMLKSEYERKIAGLERISEKAEATAKVKK